jgi:hypothetical protein
MAAIQVKPPPFYKFCKKLLGIKLSIAQTALCKVAFDGKTPEGLFGPEKDVAKTIFGGIPGDIPPEARRVVNATCGRGSGKSYVLGGARLLYLGLTTPLPTLAPGEPAFGIIVAPSLKLARQTLRFISGAVESVPALAKLVESNTTDVLVLRRPQDARAVRFECFAASGRGSEMRGKSVFGAFMDEAALFRDENYLVCDEVIFSSLMPRILEGGQVIVASSPWAREGLLWDQHQKNFGDPKNAIAALAPTTLMRPDANTAAIVAAERARDPENARREYDAEFMDSGAYQFFETSAIDACVDATLSPINGVEGQYRLPFRGDAVTCGGDLGFRSDSSALAIVHRSDAYRLAELHELRPQAGVPLKPTAVIGRFIDRMKVHGIEYFVADGHYKEAVREQLEGSDLMFKDAPAGVNGIAETYIKARLLMREKKVRIPKHERLIAQLRATIAKPTSGGALTISHPRTPTGGHGDLVSAFVLALWEAGGMEYAPAETHEVETKGYYDKMQREMEEAYENKWEKSKTQEWWEKV